MKAFYLLLTVVALFLMTMQSVITFATPREEATVSHMEQEPDKWRVDVTEDNFYFKKEDSERLKKDVLVFFQQAGSPTYSKLGGIFNCLAIVFGFSAVGYFRERWVQRDRKRAEQVSGGNG
jgi:hypothetical protein